MKLVGWVGWAISIAAAMPALAADGPRPVVVRDDLGVEVRFPTPPRRVVSLAPSITETVFALGGGDLLVGVSAHCDEPPEARNLPRVGAFGTPDLERVLNLNADLVLVTTVAQEGVGERLRSAGVRVYGVFPRSVEELIDSIHRLGIALGRPSAGDSLARSLAAEFDEVRRRVDRIPPEDRVSVFFEIDPDPLMTVTGDSFEGSLIRLAGGSNVAESYPRSYTRIEAERLFELDPDVIVLAHDRSSAADLARRRGWRRLGAVRTGRVCDGIDPDLLVRPGPRSGKGALALFHCFYPSAGRKGAERGVTAP